MQRAVGVNGAHRVAELVNDREIAVPLQHLERLGIVDAARHAKRPALQARVVRGARVEVLLAGLERGGQIRNRAAFDDARTRRRIPPRPVRLEVVIRGAGGLPDAGEIGFAVGEAREFGLRGRGRSALTSSTAERQGRGPVTGQHVGQPAVGVGVSVAGARARGRAVLRAAGLEGCGHRRG